MQQVVIRVKDDTKMDFFLNLIKHLDFVEVKKKIINKDKKIDKSSETNTKLSKNESDVDFSEYTELNELTLETLENSKKGIGVKSHENLELLYKDLGI